MKAIRLSVVSVLLVAFVTGFSAFGASKDYTPVLFKKNIQKNTTLTFQTNIIQDFQSLFNILKKKKVVAALKTAKKPTAEVKVISP